MRKRFESGTPCARRPSRAGKLSQALNQVADTASQTAGRGLAWGPLSTFGLIVAVVACALDQATKFWLLDVFDLGSRGSVPVAPYTDFVLTWNTGISYGLFPQQGAVGQWALLLFKVAAVIFLWIWLARAQSRLTAAALGLIIGGAVGNALDRLHWPGVLDFVFWHVESAGFTFRWYVYNVADVAIVAGVIGLLYEALRGDRAAKAP
jgi:signal peptidase II